MFGKKRVLPVVTLISVLALGACAQGVGLTATPSDNKQGSAPQPRFAQFSDIPIPTGAVMNLERTLVLGSKEVWVGRLVISSSHKSADMFAFFKQRSAEFGWREVTSVRSEISVLTFSRAERVMTVQIKSKRLSGSEMDITVAPRENGSVASSGGSMPPMTSLPPRAPIQRLN